MELRMRYATTADGVRIAYATAGDGLPLVRVPSAPFSHCQLEWRESTFYDRLSEGRMVVTFDPRGTGLSDRDVTDFTLDARLLDIEAVVDHAGLETFALNGIWHSGTVVIAYAARHPERVSHLVLDDTFADAAAVAKSPQSRAFTALAGDWEVMTENIAFAVAGAGGDEARRYAEFLRACTTHEAARRMWAVFDKVNVTELLPQIKTPTLILQHTGLRSWTVDNARQMAAMIPDAHLVMLEGKEGDDLDQLLSTLGEFLGDATVAVAADRPQALGGFATILFTDMASSTALTEQLGDAAAQEVRRAHNDIVRAALRANGGNEVKHTGDGIMASFSTTSSALDCAIGIQRGVAAHTEEHPDSPLGVYVGLNAGEPIAEDDDLFGTSINLAARICDRAESGQILAANVVRELAAGKDFLFADLGHTELRGFEDPVKLWELRWREGAI